MYYFKSDLFRSVKFRCIYFIRELRKVSPHFADRKFLITLREAYNWNHCEIIAKIEMVGEIYFEFINFSGIIQFAKYMRWGIIRRGVYYRYFTVVENKNIASKKWLLTSFEIEHSVYTFSNDE